ncbi:MAG: SgcJ/EcaC family oxidoreductase [Planctomycetes bacterium]|nr:SgcJ/EcaC family oxidoreductase [Planctomycetota bacterium]
MRKSALLVMAIAVAALLSVNWSSFAQGPDKAKTPAAPAKKAPDKPAEPAKPGADSKPKAAAPTAAPAKPAAGEAAADDETADEQTIRKGAETFVAAYNKHDAKAVAALFAPKAEITDEQGNLVKGRDAIEQEYKSVFEDAPEGKIFIDIESVRVLTPNIAVEEGLVRSQPVPDGAEDVSSYIAVHVKVEGQWMIGSVKDFALETPKLTANDHLQDLAWLIGEWVEESPESVVHTLCDWHDNGNFLIQEFRVQISGQVAMSGTMRIGWDAVRKQFKSWVFDSHGGNAEGIWIQAGDTWIVKSHGATAAGETASATYLYRPIDDDTIGWSAVDRVIDGELQDDIPEIVIKRKPPQPVE